MFLHPNPIPTQHIHHVNSTRLLLFWDSFISFSYAACLILMLYSLAGLGVENEVRHPTHSSLNIPVESLVDYDDCYWKTARGYPSTPPYFYSLAKTAALQTASQIHLPFSATSSETATSSGSMLPTESSHDLYDHTYHAYDLDMLFHDHDGPLAAPLQTITAM